jgi:hypothetical protein
VRRSTKGWISGGGATGSDSALVMSLASLREALAMSIWNGIYTTLDTARGVPVPRQGIAYLRHGNTAAVLSLHVST